MADGSAANGDKGSEDKSSGIDLFELVTAIVLGLGALGGAWAGFQSGLWGGNQATSYAEAASMMAQAASVASEAGTDSTEASQTANRDADIDVQVTRLLFEAEKQFIRAAAKAKTDEERKAAKDEVDEQRSLAKYLYVSQMSDTALKFLGLGHKERAEDITDEELAAAAGKSLDEKYYHEIYASSEGQYEAGRTLQTTARKKFNEGMVANYKGDLHAFTGVLYTVCLFLAGIGLVFKSRVRWVFGGLAIVMLGASTIHLFRNEWTKLEAPQIEAAGASPAASGSASAPAPAHSAPPGGSGSAAK